MVAQLCLGRLPEGIPPPRRLALRARPQLGDYYLTCQASQPYRAEAYSYPPPFPNRQFICTIDPDTYLGPVAAAAETEETVSILVSGWWIDVWKRVSAKPFSGKEDDIASHASTSPGCPIQLAGRIPRHAVSGWFRQGWCHQRPSGPLGPW